MFKKYNKCKVIDDVKIIKNVTMRTHIQQTCNLNGTFPLHKKLVEKNK